MKKLTDEQKLEAMNALYAFKLAKLTKAKKELSNAIENTKRFSEKQKLEKQLNYIDEKRDEASDLLSLTFD